MSLPGFHLKGPCKSCPFRGDGAGVGHLRRGRITEIRYASTFTCHETVQRRDGDDDGLHPLRSSEQVCGGWLAACWKLDGGFHQVTAFAASAGLFDPHALKVDKVWDSWEAMMEHNSPTRGTGHPCYTAEPGCQHPAGWSGGQTNPGADAQHECAACGDPVCTTCSKENPSRPEERWCGSCAVTAGDE